MHSESSIYRVFEPHRNSCKRTHNCRNILVDPVCFYALDWQDRDAKIV